MVTAIPEPDDRLRSWSAQLTQAHDSLQDRLAAVRRGLGASGGNPRDLITHCLAFCSALTRHHVGECTGLFAQLRQTRPDLDPMIANLVQDHQLIANILARVEGLAAESVDAAIERREAIGRELDGLGAIVESHFRYEERALRTALDAVVPDPSWRQRVFGPLGSSTR